MIRSDFNGNQGITRQRDTSEKYSRATLLRTEFDWLNEYCWARSQDTELRTQYTKSINIGPVIRVRAKGDAMVLTKGRASDRQTDRVLVAMTPGADMVSRKRHPVSRSLWPDHDTTAYFARRSPFRRESSSRALCHAVRPPIVNHVRHSSGFIALLMRQQKILFTILYTRCVPRNTSSWSSRFLLSILHLVSSLNVIF